MPSERDVQRASVPRFSRLHPQGHGVFLMQCSLKKIAVRSSVHAAWGGADVGEHCAAQQSEHDREPFANSLSHH